MSTTESQILESRLAKVSNPVTDVCYQLKLAPSPFPFPFVVLDVGAGGVNVIEFKEIASLCQVHAVEPQTPLPNLGGFGKFISYNTALSDKTGPQTLYITDVPEASSLLRPNSINIKRCGGGNDIGFRVVEERIVDCETLEAFSKRSGITRCDFFKLDTQGTELNILLSGAHLLSNTSIILMEIEFVRLYEDQYLFDDVVRELSKIGFRYVNFTHGRSLWALDLGTSPHKRISCDALFLRDTPGAMQRDEILRAAIILCELGYYEEGIWFMQDHFVAEETIALIANAFRTLALSNEGFISRRILFPIVAALKSHKFRGRGRLINFLSRFAFIASLLRIIDTTSLLRIKHYVGSK